MEWKATFGRERRVSDDLGVWGTSVLAPVSPPLVWVAANGRFVCNMIKHILDPDVLSISTNKIGVSVFRIFVVVVFFLRLSHLLKIFPYATILTCVSKFTCLLVFWKENSDAWITRETMGFYLSVVRAKYFFLFTKSKELVSVCGYN